MYLSYFFLFLLVKMGKMDGNNVHPAASTLPTMDHRWYIPPLFDNGNKVRAPFESESNIPQRALWTHSEMSPSPATWQQYLIMTCSYQPSSQPNYSMVTQIYSRHISVTQMQWINNYSNNTNNDNNNIGNENYNGQHQRLKQSSRKGKENI